MSLADLQALAANYEDSYFGQSDKAIAKTILDLIVEILAAHEADIANRMLCTKYKAP